MVRLIGVLALLAAGIALVARTAWGHLALQSSVPARGARLSEVPREIRLTFTEAAELSMAAVELRSADGAQVPLAPLRAVADSPQVIVAAVAGRLAAGAYTVDWRVTSRDGHPVRGRFAFTILPNAGGVASTDTSAASGADSGIPARGRAAAGVVAPGQPPAEHHTAGSEVAQPGTALGADSPAYVAIRAAQYVALLLVIGAVVFRFLVLGALARTARTSPDNAVAQSPDFVNAAVGATARVGLAAAVVVALAAAARLAAQSIAVLGAERAFEPELVATMIRRTVWGWGWLLQAASTALVLAGFALAARRLGRDETAPRREAPGWRLAVVGAGVLAVTPALSGHAAAARVAPLAVLADAGHVLGAGAWLGTLALLLAVGVPAARRLDATARDRAVADLVHAFSPVALACAGLVAVTGVFASLLHLGHLAALWQSDYGRTLLVKLALVAAVMGAGAYNWRRLRPALGSAAATGRLRRSAATELAVAALVLAATAVLVATPAPAEGAGEPPMAAAHPSAQ